MGYTNSNLINYAVNFGDKYCNPRKNAKYNPTGAITKITIHHMAGVMDAKRCAEMHLNGSRGASANYYIGNDGKICLGVDESKRAQTSSSSENDYVAITIEVSNSAGAPNQPVSNAAYNSLIRLCIDICKRNNIKQINYTGNKNGNLTRHNMFAATACPGPYLQNKFYDIAKEINAGIGSNSTPVIQNPTPIPAQNNEQIIQNYLMSKIKNPYGVAGLMGNLYAESGLRPNNLQNSYEKSLKLTDEQYTVAVDNGTYTNFVQDKAGYGIAQQTFQTRKQNLYSYAKRSGTSIADLNMQLEFLCEIELPGYRTVQNTLQTARSVKEASDIVLTQFEKPKDQSDNMKNKRAGYGQTFYNNYINGSSIINPTPTAAYKVKVVVDALNYRTGPGTNYKILGTIRDKDIYEITEEKNGWGKATGKGWICLKYTKKV